MTTTSPNLLNTNVGFSPLQHQALKNTFALAGGVDEIDTLNLGKSGTQGTLNVFPATASSGQLTLTAANNAGNTTTTITNASFGQTTALTIPDPGSATANFLLSKGNPTIQTGSLFIESAADSITAHAGGTQAAAFALTNEINRVTTVATAADSVKLPASIAGLTIFVINHGANAMQVFGAGTDTIDDVATATGVSQMPGSVVLYTCTTAGAWYSEGLATGYSGQYQTLLSSDSLTAHAGGTQAGALPLTAMVNRVTTVATAADSVRLPASAAGMVIIVTNSAALSMQVYGAGTDTINSVATATGVSQNGGATVTYICTTAGNWVTNTNIQVGGSGVAGTVNVFPGTAANGQLILSAVNNTGNFNTTLSNSNVGQATVYSLPDPGQATTNIVLDQGNQTIAGNKTLTGTTQANTLNIGASGTVGSMSLFSTTASKGKWLFTPVDNTGNTTMTITNAAQAGAYTYTIPSVGASANFLFNNNGTGTESGNAVTINNLSGVITTSSLSTAGGSNYVITLTNSFVASTSKVIVNIAGGSNTNTFNISTKAVAGSGSVVITIYNNTAATSLNGTLLLNFFVIP